ncbi:MAG: hypothetical protein AAF533_07990 [Acidobacteriota bacterium]
MQEQLHEDPMSNSMAVLDHSSKDAVFVEIGRAAATAKRALEAALRERQVDQLAELTLIAMQARHWREDGYTLPPSLEYVARRFA